ncbi:dihydrouridine synthase [Streptomyces sp. NBC_01750]|uniref:dihydrouridine synthase n=1 Tax=Streptomyces sp. NBC_01750 TaxID=2975928 RepID=UPI002DDC3C45|nr:dihydrouridine synthase [Streptomyces sp. NBC_01750]WSD38087.1 dihydrouridine synthase [Streptomyces sp. NBC_01750]
MLLALAVITTGGALRQIDRARFAYRRPRTASSAQLIALQRNRANNWTPTLLLAGQWLQITGWWMLAAHGPLPAATAAVAVAVHFRHLQEISHFAVHGVLARSARANLLLAEAFAHHPLAFDPVTMRRQRHVRDHHPNATVAGTDPNLAELHQAGLRPGATRLRFAVALVHPLTARGIHTTAASLAAGLRHPGAWHRTGAAAAVPLAAYLAGGWTAVICGVLVPRLLLYPQLAWLSLLVEHTWFDPQPRTGTPTWVEAGRCLRLYPRSHVLAHIAAATWLPYGDLHHYAHSAHPAVRWSYLPALERHLGRPHFTPAALLLGDRSVARRHLHALTRGAHSKAAS